MIQMYGKGQGWALCQKGENVYNFWNAVFLRV